MNVISRNSDAIHDVIVAWIVKKTGVDAATTGADTELLERQVLDSLQLMDLVFYLEETFGEPIPLELLVPENFATPRTIADMLGKLNQ